MKTSVKKIISAALALMLMAFCFTGCKTEKKDTYVVGICQLAQHDALDAATNGFMKALKDKLGDKVRFDLQNASGEATNCTTICSKFVSDKVDLIMANATGALSADSCHIDNRLRDRARYKGLERYDRIQCHRNRRSCSS